MRKKGQFPGIRTVPRHKDCRKLPRQKNWRQSPPPPHTHTQPHTFENSSPTLFVSEFELFFTNNFEIKKKRQLTNIIIYTD